MKEFLLLTPGPTNVPKRILDRTAVPMIHHRTKDYQAILERVNGNLRKIFYTQEPVLTFAASGTGAMDSSITNLLSAGDMVLVFTAGKWGERYRDIAKAYGLDVKSIEKAYGEAFAAQEVAAEIAKYPQAKAIITTLCETSTAVRHAIKEIAQLTRNTDKLLMVDAISGLMCDELRMDEWGIDVVLCGSQKGMMLPPGLAFVALSQKAQKAIPGSKLPKFYFNYAQTIKTLLKNDTPFTPAVSLVQGLDEALVMLTEEGVENVWKRHEEVSKFVRESVTAMGLKLFSKSPTAGLTAIVMPDSISSSDAIKIMRDEHQVIMADGQGELQGKIVRFAHMGYACTRKDAETGLKAFKSAMNKLGYKSYVTSHSS